MFSEISSILGTQGDFIYWAMAESALIFDTHEDIQELVKSGMPEPQAETLVRQRVRLLERNLATKADIAATNANIETLRQETEKTDSSRQERYYQVGCWRQSRGRRLDRGRNQTPLIAGLDGAQSASRVAPVGSMSAPMLTATLAADSLMESRARWA